MSLRIYVGNLPFTASNEQIAQLFGAYGAVSEATVVLDRDSGQSKGFGFVAMTDDAAAQAAISALNGTTLDDRTIRVSEARARVERASGTGPRPTSGYRDSRW